MGLATPEPDTRLHGTRTRRTFSMRPLPILAVLLVGMTLADSPAAAAAPAEQFRAAARALLEEGRGELAAGDQKAALRHLEAALVADPGNVAAMIAIGEAHEAMERRKVALGYYRRALVIEPTSRPALLAESLALIADDTPAKAEENLERLRRLCAEGPCEEADRIARALADRRADKGSDG